MPSQKNNLCLLTLGNTVCKKQKQKGFPPFIYGILAYEMHNFSTKYVFNEAGICIERLPQSILRNVRRRLLRGEKIHYGGFCWFGGILHVKVGWRALEGFFKPTAGNPFFVPLYEAMHGNFIPWDNPICQNHVHYWANICQLTINVRTVLGLCFCVYANWGSQLCQFNYNIHCKVILHAIRIPGPIDPILAKPSLISDTYIRWNWQETLFVMQIVHLNRQSYFFWITCWGKNSTIELVPLFCLVPFSRCLFVMCPCPWERDYAHQILASIFVFYLCNLKSIHSILWNQNSTSSNDGWLSNLQTPFAT